MPIFALEISFHVAVQRCLFDDKEKATAELELLAPKIGRHWYGKNGDDSPTHTVNSPAGPLVVVLEKIEAVRIVDSTTHDALAEESLAKAQAQAIAFDALLAKSRKAAE